MKHLETAASTRLNKANLSPKRRRQLEVWLNENNLSPAHNDGDYEAVLDKAERDFSQKELTEVMEFFFPNVTASSKELADDQGPVMLTEPIIKWADAFSEDGGFANGTWAHHMHVGLIAYTRYMLTMTQPDKLVDFKKALMTNAPALRKVLDKMDKQISQ